MTMRWAVRSWLVLCCPVLWIAVTASAQPMRGDPVPAPVKLSGRWHGEGWGDVVLADSGGTFSKTATGKPGEIAFRRTGNRSFSGSWRQSTVHGGALVFGVSLDGRSLHGTYWRDLGGGSTTPAAKFTWRRVAVGSEFRLRVFRDRAKFVAALGATRRVGFDDLATPAGRPGSFAKDRYADRGMIIEGVGGQVVDRAFGYPEQFVPVSKPNMYAPGPLLGADPKLPRGGCKTDVSFRARGRQATTTGFGLWLIDVDHPHIAASRVILFDSKRRELGRVSDIATADGGRAFVGVIVVNEHGAPVPAIQRVQIVNGDGWPGLTDGEGVALDDFECGVPVARK